MFQLILQHHDIQPVNQRSNQSSNQRYKQKVQPNPTKDPASSAAHLLQEAAAQDKVQHGTCRGSPNPRRHLQSQLSSTVPRRTPQPAVCTVVLLLHFWGLFVGRGTMEWASAFLLVPLTQIIAAGLTNGHTRGY